MAAVTAFFELILQVTATKQEHADEYRSHISLLFQMYQKAHNLKFLLYLWPVKKLKN